MTTPKKTYTDRIVRGAYRAAQHKIQVAIDATNQLHHDDTEEIILRKQGVIQILTIVQESIGDLTTAEALHFAAHENTEDQP